MILFLLSAIPICASACGIVRVFAGRTERLIFWPMVLFAEIVLLAEAASLNDALTSKTFWIAGSFVWFGLGILAARYFGVEAERGGPAPFWKWAAPIAVTAYAGIFLAGILLPPNTWDGMSYHVARVGYYLQQGSLEHFTTNNVRQTDFPLNAELFMLWTVALTRSDALAVLIQYIAALGSAIAVHGLSRRMHLPRFIASLAGLIVLGLPQVALQASSTQNDLTVAWLICVSVYGVVAFAQTRQRSFALAAGLCGGLALGTKLTATLFIPGAALLAVAAAPRSARIRTLGMLAAALIVGAIVFAGPHAYRNYRSKGRLMAAATRERVSEPTAATFGANAARASIEFVDGNGLPYPMNRAVGVAKRTAFTATGLDLEWLNPPAGTFVGTRFEFANNVLSEDVAWYGPLGVLLAIGAVVSAAHGVRQRRWLWPCSVAVAAFAVCGMWWALRWQPWSGRFYCGAVLIIIPAGLKGCAFLLRRRRRWLRRGAWHAVAGMSALSCVVVLLQNELKPLIPVGRQPSVFSLTRDEQRCRHRPYNVALAHFVNDLPSGHIGFCADPDQWDRLAFGEDFRHVVTRYDDKVDLAKAFGADGCDAIIYQRNYGPTPTSAEYIIEELNDYWIVIRPEVARNRPAD